MKLIIDERGYADWGKSRKTARRRREDDMMNGVESLECQPALESALATWSAIVHFSLSFAQVVH